MRFQSTYSEDEVPPAPIVEATLYDPIMEAAARLTAKVDSGFSGSVLIPLDQYLKLGLQLYEEPQKAVAGRLATGVVVPLRTSKGVLQIGSEQVPCSVYCTPLLQKPLVGRELLNLWRTVLNGPKRLVEMEF